MDNDRTRVEKRHSFFSYLLRSHLTIAAIGAAALLMALVTGTFITYNLLKLTNKTVPIFATSSGILQGVQRSLANMRGWVSLGDTAFEKDWHDVWKKDIHPATVELQELAQSMPIPGFSQRVAELILLLSELKESQWWIFEIAQTPGNEPAKTVYHFEAGPILHSLDAITQSLLQADQGTLGTTLLREEENPIHRTLIEYYRVKEILQEIIFQGRTQQEEQFHSSLSLLKETTAELSLFVSYNPELGVTVHALQRELMALERVSEKSIKIRKSVGWNVSRHLMETETLPISNRITMVMKALTTDLNDQRDRQLWP
jgi:hypothetical protein